MREAQHTVQPDRRLLPAEFSGMADALRWHDAREAPFRLYGFDGGEGAAAPDDWRRLPRALAETIERGNEGFASLTTCTAGARLRFSTDAQQILIWVRHELTMRMPHMPLLGQNGFDLYIDGPHGSHYAGSFQPPPDAPHEVVLARSFPTRERRELTLYFPLFASVSALHVGLPEDASLEAGRAYAAPEPVLAYGSSITHGGCASRPGNAWPALVGRALDLDMRNLGFSGHARGEIELADYFAQTPAHAIVLDYDHNAPDAAHLEATLYPMVARIRRSRPTLPLLLVSKPDVHLTPQALDPAGATERRRRREAVREAYERARAQGDAHIDYIDGYELFLDGEMPPDADGESLEARWYREGIDACTVDTCHPNDLGFWRMARRIGRSLATLLERTT